MVEYMQSKCIIEAKNVKTLTKTDIDKFIRDVNDGDTSTMYALVRKGGAGTNTTLRQKPDMEIGQKGHVIVWFKYDEDSFVQMLPFLMVEAKHKRESMVAQTDHSQTNKMLEEHIKSQKVLVDKEIKVMTQHLNGLKKRKTDMEHILESAKRVKPSPLNAVTTTQGEYYSAFSVDSDGEDSEALI